MDKSCSHYIEIPVQHKEDGFRYDGVVYIYVCRNNEFVFTEQFFEIVRGLFGDNSGIGINDTLKILADELASRAKDGSVEVTFTGSVFYEALNCTMKFWVSHFRD